MDNATAHYQRQHQNHPHPKQHPLCGVSDCVLGNEEQGLCQVHNDTLSSTVVCPFEALGLQLFEGWIVSVLRRTFGNILMLM